MKGIWIVLVTLFLAACGSGGSSSSPANLGKDDPVGRLTVTFAPETGKALAALPAGKHFRVVITNPTFLFEGKPFSAIQDADPGDTIGFALPVANGYVVEALAFNTDATTGLNMLAKYAKAGAVRVTASDIPASVTLTLVPVAAKVVPPAAIYQGPVKSYNVQASYSSALGRQATPLDTKWYLYKPQTATFAPFVNRTSATPAKDFGNTHLFVAPTTGGVPTDLYFQGVFTVKPSMLKPGESMKQWVFNAPEVSAPVRADINTTIDLPGDF